MLYGTCGTDSVSSKVATVFVASTTYIAKQVENSYAGIGGVATLSVDPEVSGTATGDAVYQWYRNGVALSDNQRINGSSSSVLTISNLQPSDTAATYYATVTGVCGTAQSNTARITVLSLTITEAPKAVEVCPGATATMSVTAESATSGAQLSYQWYRNNKPVNNGGNISGATTSTLTIANASALDLYTDYRVRVTSQPGDVVVMSQPVYLNLAATTAILTQPSAQTICEGEALDLAVTAAGSGLSYEWRMNGTAVTGATAAGYSVASATPAMSGMYTVVVKGLCGEVTSSEVAVTVKAKPAFTTQPQDVDQNQFNDLTLTATATGEGTLSYQWYKDGVAIPGATGASYTKPNSSPADQGTYYVEVTGECGMARSEDATVSISTGMQDRPAAGYSLDATTPSPVSDKATISFTLATSEFTRIAITDMFGREVAVVVNGFTEAGSHSAAFSAGELNLASGIYIYTISTPSFQLSKQLVVVR
ncbi:MAG: T9SS type A sorting domain-containing protein [Sphingobacteriales bacterium]|nr:MAG: T9SS type A sorting domain-containing protein [Sphingobacteriales bacterium]